MRYVYSIAMGFVTFVCVGWAVAPVACWAQTEIPLDPQDPLGKPWSVSRPGISEGRFNSLLFFGSLAAYGFHRDNRTLILAGALTLDKGYSQWSRRRSRERSEDYQQKRFYIESNGAENEPYEFRSGRGGTALGLGLLTLYGAATNKKTLVTLGAVSTVLAQRRYKQTRKEKARFKARQRSTDPVVVDPEAASN